MSNQEIERKFIVTNPYGAQSETVLCTQTIKQGYLSRADSSIVRIRWVETVYPSKHDLFPHSVSLSRTSGFITVKSANVGITRQEYEYEIPGADADSMLTLLAPAPIITKTRLKIKDEHNQYWDVDFFHGSREGLVLAEIELLFEHQNIILPDWVGEEVSTNPKYFNSNM